MSDTQRGASSSFRPSLFLRKSSAGDEVLPRKKFIETHAKKVKNLDI